MKKILIVGGGISGTFASILVKEKHKDYQVYIFEHNDKLLKKIYATGNGKCNFANKGELVNKYNHEDFVLPILNKFTYLDIINIFRRLGIEIKEVGDLLYPYSETAETVAVKLLNRVKELNIDVHLLENVKEYDDKYLYTDKGRYEYDHLIISTGGQSSPKLGSNGSIYQILEKHHYDIKKMSPSLCPIMVKENTKMVEGLRHKSLVKLYQGNKLIHQEEGEVLFKKDGLSGMVIFNITHFINTLDNHNNITIHIDFAPHMDNDYYSLIHPRIAEYLLKNKLDIHNTIFTFKRFYDYQYSQVTSGGLSIKELNNDLSSKKENNIHFIGEVIDIDAVCGGYNIMWALGSAHEVVESL